MKLKEFLKEYEDVRWYNQPNEQRFIFNTNAERFQFIQRLDGLEADYRLYEDKSGFKIEVYIAKSH